MLDKISKDFVCEVIKNVYNLENLERAYAFSIMYDVRKYFIQMFHYYNFVEEKGKLEDEYLKYTNPVYFENCLYNEEKYNSEELLNDVENKINEIIGTLEIKIQSFKRIKSIYSTTKRIKERGLYTYDKYGIRIALEANETDSYQLLWYVVNFLKEKCNIMRVTDYLSHPRLTGYSAIHVIISFGNMPVEVQLIIKKNLIEKVPHYKYKQEISTNNLYLLNLNTQDLKDIIINDYKSNLKCHLRIN